MRPTIGLHSSQLITISQSSFHAHPYCRLHAIIKGARKTLGATCWPSGCRFTDTPYYVDAFTDNYMTGETGRACSRVSRQLAARDQLLFLRWRLQGDQPRESLILAQCRSEGRVSGGIGPIKGRGAAMLPGQTAASGRRGGGGTRGTPLRALRPPWPRWRPEVGRPPTSIIHDERGSNVSWKR